MKWNNVVFVKISLYDYRLIRCHSSPKEHLLCEYFFIVYPDGKKHSNTLGRFVPKRLFCLLRKRPSLPNVFIQTPASNWQSFVSVFLLFSAKKVFPIFAFKLLFFVSKWDFSETDNSLYHKPDFISFPFGAISQFTSFCLSVCKVSLYIS